jgi:hypothetical protein
MEYGWYVTDTYGGLSQAEKEHNASRAMSLLRQNGFTIYSAAGIVGNMWAESLMNPGQWEGDTPYSGGYGLVQWTPYTLYSDWAVTDWENNGPKEIQRILYERDNRLEFFPSTQYPTWNWTKYENFVPEEGLTDDETVNVCASVFLYNYIRSSNPGGSEANRKYHARYVFHHCAGTVIPAWLLFKWSKLNRRVFT